MRPISLPPDIQQGCGTAGLPAAGRQSSETRILNYRAATRVRGVWSAEEAAPAQKKLEEPVQLD